MYSASPSMERRVRVSCLDHRMPALLLEVAIADWEGAGWKRLLGSKVLIGRCGQALCAPVYLQEPADSSLSGLIAEKPGLRTAFLAGRPQGNESYRQGVRITVAAS